MSEQLAGSSPLPIPPIRPSDIQADEDIGVGSGSGLPNKNVVDRIVKVNGLQGIGMASSGEMPAKDWGLQARSLNSSYIDSTRPIKYDSMSANNPAMLSVNHGMARKGSFGMKDGMPEVLVDGAESESLKALYPPPKKPLSPYQLRRIAATFGIVIPNLPLPPMTPISPTPSETHSSARAGLQSPLFSPYSQATRTGYLLSVIPPVILLPSAATLTPDQTRKREKRWRRGMLMPLQPTMGGMLLCIAREYGLPSIVGIHLYLVYPSSSTPNSPVPTRKGTFEEDEDSEEEPDGPRISPNIWSTLFSPLLLHPNAAGSSSRSPTPSQVLNKGGSGDTDGDIINPFAKRKNRETPSHQGHQPALSTSSTSSHLSARFPIHDSASSITLSPSMSTLSSPNPIVGTIEFDIDMNEAEWFEEWQSKSGRRRVRKISGETDNDSVNGVRELGLVKKHNSSPDPKLRFLREFEGGFQSAPPSPTIQQAREQEKDAQVFEVVQLLDSQGVRREDLLASPIQLGWQENDGNQAVKRVKEVLEKRWSGFVMSEQLDDLERIMRQLSPREIRITSPTYMSRCTTEKINKEITFAAASNRVTGNGALSPLSGEIDLTPNLDVHSDSDSSEFGDSIEAELPPPQSQLPTTVKPSMQEHNNEEQPTWLSRPLHTPSMPSSSSISPFFRPNFPSPRNVSSPADMTSETLQRMQTEQENTKKHSVSTEWVPRRPIRPPSPKLNHQNTLSHRLSTEYVGILKSPPGSSSPNARNTGSPRNESDENKKRKPSLKGLRRQMSNANIKWRGDKGDHSSIPSPPVSVGMESSTEFGNSEDQLAEKSSSLPSKGKFTSRLFHSSFGFKRHDAQPSHTRKHPSHDGPIQISEISSPITSTFRHTRSGSLASTLPESATLPSHPINRKDSTSSNHVITSPVQSFHTPIPSTPTTPASPKSVKRKPVPGITNNETGLGMDVDRTKGSLNMGNMPNFVLEDPPKGRRGLGMGMAV
ncbi:uncharacterized protein L203_102186 [Cryptococcus depauperatus CBS 7841]|uniref:Uncharacterized protein n=1 Tax=Cryptococcus depauperatus CBS 7841 TaxID=1295531 RepID=A0A1E3IRK3_9TREE|nr:hypothetical protein L203_01441 [Cryptococcus depauperatus CBS 7841]